VKFVRFGALACLLLSACGRKNIDTLDAVKQGVVKDIGKSVNIGAMDVNVVSATFRDKEADAVVSFAPKGGTAQQGLTMQYTMERKDDEWHIKSRAQSDLQKHAGQAGPGMGGPSAEQQQSLPPGHPSTDGAGSGQPLPPGHPPLNSSPK